MLVGGRRRGGGGVVVGALKWFQVFMRLVFGNL